MNQNPNQQYQQPMMMQQGQPMMMMPQQGQMTHQIVINNQGGRKCEKKYRSDTVECLCAVFCLGCWIGEKVYDSNNPIAKGLYCFFCCPSWCAFNLFDEGYRKWRDEHRKEYGY